MIKQYEKDVKIICQIIKSRCNDSYTKADEVSKDKTEEVFSGRSQWQRGLRRGSAAVRLLGLRIRIPPGTWLSFANVVCFR